MPRISNIEILQRREQATLSIRTTTKVEDLPVLIGESYGKMGEISVVRSICGLPQHGHAKT